MNRLAGRQSKRAERAYKTLLGLSGRISEQYFHPDIFFADQLYDLSKDPNSRRGQDSGYAEQLKKMKAMLQNDKAGPAPIW